MSHNQETGYLRLIPIQNGYEVWPRVPDEQEDLHIPTHPEESEKTKSVKRRRKTIIEKANLNPKYTFDTFGFTCDV